MYGLCANSYVQVLSDHQQTISSAWRVLRAQRAHVSEN